MRLSTVIAVAVVLACCFLNESSAQSTLCPNNMPYKNGCESCKCHADGLGYDCDLKGCAPKRVRRDGGSTTCPGEGFAWKKDCHACKCTSSSAYSCRQETCSPNKRQ